MAAEILKIRSRLWLRLLRKHTRQLRFLLNLVRLRWRLWLSPLWRYPLESYTELPQDPWVADSSKGNALMEGRFCEEMGVESYEGDLWGSLSGLSPDYQRRMHEFQWLRNLAACQNQTKAASYARYLVSEWQQKQADHHPMAMQMSVRAERLANCLCYLHFLEKGAPEDWVKKQDRYYAEEILQLSDFLRRKGAFSGFYTLKALLFAAMIFPQMGFLYRPVSRFLMLAIGQRFNEDGGHATRSPEFQWRDLYALLSIRAAMKKRQMPIDADFDDSLQTQLDALASLSHGDGKTACFHSSIEHPVTEMMNLWQTWRKSKPLPQKTLPQTGYVHLKRFDTRLVMDVGYKAGLAEHHYSGPLACEISREGARMIVNCGAYRGDSAIWHEVGHHTAAHSTLCFDHFDAWSMGGKEKTERKGHCAVEEKEGGIRVIADHYGYATRFDLQHERQVYISDEGGRIEGIDRIRPASKAAQTTGRIFGQQAENVFVRFHLHPTVSVEKMTPQFVSLRLRNNELWNYSVENGEMVPIVEESIYLGSDGLPHKTMQLVIQSPYHAQEPQKQFRWKFELQKLQPVTSIEE